MDNHVTGNIGLYYCCYRLSRLGWNVMPTARNARGIDVIAYNADASKLISIQVKTLSNRNSVPLGNSLQKIMGDYWVIVTRVSVEPVAYIMLPDEVKELSGMNEKQGKYTFWLDPPRYDKDQFREAWDRIGYGSDSAALRVAARGARSA